MAADGPEISSPAGYVPVTAARTLGAAATVDATAVTRSPVVRSVSASVSISRAASRAPRMTTRTTACSARIRRARDQLEPVCTCDLPGLPRGPHRRRPTPDPTQRTGHCDPLHTVGDPLHTLTGPDWPPR